MAQARYEPNPASLAGHVVPDWYRDAKLGIFIHWGVSSIPAFAPRSSLQDVFAGAGQAASPYAEWYWNSLKIGGSPVQKHHRAVYGDRSYESFADEFRSGIERWDPLEWVRAFESAGARYVVLVTKHHDGFCLWPSAVPHPNPRWRAWRSERDVVGELAEATRRHGMRFGTYYSGGLDWTFEARPLLGIVDLIAGMPGGEYPEYAAAQVRELIGRTSPEILWNDISWPDAKEALWRLVADYYNAVPDGVVNDRWQHRPMGLSLLRLRPVSRIVDAIVRRAMIGRGGMGAPPLPTVFDYRTPEYTSFGGTQEQVWECVRGIDRSFGFNRNSQPEDFLTREELLHSFIDIVSKNGNLLLNVGPRGDDARIPEVQLERLRWLGEFLEVNGDAIYGSRPWKRAEGTTYEGIPVRFTCRAGRLYATLLGTPTSGVVTLVDAPDIESDAVVHLGSSRNLQSRRREDGSLRIEVGSSWSDQPAHSLCLGRIPEAS